MLAGTAVPPAFSQFPFQDRDRPESMRVPPAITSDAPPTDVPLPRVRPRMSIPLPRPAPRNVTAAATPVAPEPAAAQTKISAPGGVLLPDPPAEPGELVTGAPPAAGGVLMPIPQMPIPLSAPRPASETTTAHGAAFLPMLAQ